MEVTDTIYKIGDSINVVTHHIANESHDLTAYMTDSLKICINPTFEHQDWSVVSHLGFESGIIAVATIVVSLIIFSCVPKIVPQKLKNWISKISLKWPFLLVWIYGFVVYDVGMCTGEHISLLTNAPMAIIYAFKIFIFDSDVSEIHGAFHENWVYSFNFALVHFLAAIISTLFLIKLFGFTIVQRTKMYLASSYFGRKVSETYVFWGFNDATSHLIESIKKQYKGSSDYRVVIIRTNKAKNDPSENSTGISRIFDFLSLPSSELKRLQNLGCLTDGTHINLSTINVQNTDVDIIGSTLKMRSLKQILKSKTTNKIHMLFLSDNEKDNLHDVSIFLNDITIKEFAEQEDVHNQRQVLFYCHARYNSIHRVIEDQNPSEKLKVKVIDSSHINVEMLKLNPKLLPVNFVKVEQDATVSTPFNAMVVGFSEVGQDSVRFLYEFGAFVKKGSTDNHAERSDFRLHVIDKHMGELAGEFVTNAPAINPSMPFLADNDNPNALITLHQMDCRSVNFYQHLKNWIETLNYIVIATDDDELNISLGVRVFKAATRYRENLENFCILVRAHNDDDGHIQRIAEHYNRLWNAQKAVAGIEGKDYTQTSVRIDKNVNGPIHVFGLDKDTYTYANILDDSLERQAIEFKERYEASSNPQYEKPKKEEDKAWYKDIRSMMQLTEELKGYYPSFCGLQTLRRKQGQDMANSLHSETKKQLAVKALKKAGIPDFDWTVLSRRFESVTYCLSSGDSLNPQIIRILNTLAQTEHLRWNASHEILGYIKYGKPTYRHEIKLYHSCMTEWHNLSAETQSYDYNIVDVTLNIINPDNPIKSK